MREAAITSDRSVSDRSAACAWRRSALIGLAVASALGLVIAEPARAQADICGCAGAPSLGAFDSADQSTWPPGSSFSNANILIPMPADGVFVFDSITIDRTPTDFLASVTFQPDPSAPAPALTLLVSGDFTQSPSTTINLDGRVGVNGTTGAAGDGGLPGPGGFRGGDGVYQLVDGSDRGGDGFGPAGGVGGDTTPTAGGPADFVGIATLLPAVGGSGGGGGSSLSNALNCAGGGGGGGGGVLLLAANGTVTIDGDISARGAGGGSPRDGACATAGGPGSGGAVRVVADTIQGGGRILVTGPSGGGDGRARLEAFNLSFGADRISPNGRGTFAPAPGPLANPLTPTVTVTSVDGQAVPAPPLGSLGAIDVQIPAPGLIPIAIRTSGVPIGTTVDVTAKPRKGAAPITTTLALDAGSCDETGSCTGFVAPDLVAGSYVIEARATFQTP